MNILTELPTAEYFFENEIVEDDLVLEESRWGVSNFEEERDGLSFLISFDFDRLKGATFVLP